MAPGKVEQPLTVLLYLKWEEALIEGGLKKKFHLSDQLVDLGLEVLRVVDDVDVLVADPGFGRLEEAGGEALKETSS